MNDKIGQPDKELVRPHLIKIQMDYAYKYTRKER